MKILLINPPIPREIELYSTAGIIAPPMGLTYLAAVLEKYGYHVEILDAPVLGLSYRQIKDELEKREPDLVGITATTAMINSALQTARTVKNVLPESTVVLGGVHVTFAYETTMKGNSFVDVACIGEGEYTLLELVQT
jgi:radical SAM superfamily enzyme YgiQ (UPF0313 family)